MYNHKKKQSWRLRRIINIFIFSAKHVPLPQDDDGCIIDRLLGDIRKGYSLRKTSPHKQRNNQPKEKSPAARIRIKTSLNFTTEKADGVSQA